MARHRLDRTLSLMPTLMPTLLLALGASTAQASATNYYSLDSWTSACGRYSTIDFVGLPQGTIVTDQYVHLGASFTDQDLGVVVFSPTFASDGVGIWGFDVTELTFDTPQKAFGAESLTTRSYRLYSGETLVYATPLFGELINYFGGVTFSSGFDRVQIINAYPGSLGPIDNIYFSTVPAPSVLVGLGLGLFSTRGRRRLQRY